MLRRSSRPRHLLMEPLEIRCNLLVFDRLAGALAEPVAQVPCDVVGVGINGVGLNDNGELDVASSSGGEDSSEASRAGYTGWERIYPTD